VGRARRRVRPVRPHHRGAAPARRAGAHRPHLRAQPRDFYEKAYAGWYCVGCESFKTDDEIVDGRCELHPTRPLEWTEERNWFFRLSRYQEFLERLLRDRPEFCQPESRRNEILGLLAQGLEDVSASRARFSWGCPFPAPDERRRDAEHVRLVRRAAQLPHATGFPEPGFARRRAVAGAAARDRQGHHALPLRDLAGDARGGRAPAPRARVGARLHVARRAALQQEQRRVARPRRGRGPLRRRRAALLPAREIPFNGDGDFSWARFADRYTADLANALGNLASRTTAMIEKYRAGTVPAAADPEALAADADDLADYHACMDGTRGYLPHEALAALWRVVARANAFVQERQPWTVAKDPARAAELDAVLGTLVRRLVLVAVAVSPFMPGKAAELWAALGGPGDVDGQRFDPAGRIGADAAGWTVRKGAALFPREAASAAA
jgi:methionyl-tRNA synthetase